jgi:hypothetical protein
MEDIGLSLKDSSFSLEQWNFGALWRLAHQLFLLAFMVSCTNVIVLTS